MKQGWLLKANFNNSLSVSMKVRGVIGTPSLKDISRAVAVVVA